MSEFREEGFGEEGQADPREASGAGDDAVGEAAAVDEPLVYDAHQRQVDD